MCPNRAIQMSSTDFSSFSMIRIVLFQWLKQCLKVRYCFCCRFPLGQICLCVLLVMMASMIFSANGKPTLQRLFKSADTLRSILASYQLNTSWQCIRFLRFPSSQTFECHGSSELLLPNCCYLSIAVIHSRPWLWDRTMREQLNRLSLWVVLHC